MPALNPHSRCADETPIHRFSDYGVDHMPQTSPAQPATRMRTDVRIIACTAIVDASHVLLVKRGRGPSAECWTLPGGRLNSGEALSAAALRETRDGTGLEVDLDGVVGVYSYTGRSGQPCSRFCFSASIVAGRPRFDGRAIRDLRWFSFDQLPRVHDAVLWKPFVLRRMLHDIQRGQRLPLDLLRHFDPAFKAAA